jgi:hypothetical protein
MRKVDLWHSEFRTDSGKDSIVPNQIVDIKSKPICRRVYKE